MKNQTVIQIIIYLILFILGIYFYTTAKWIGPGRYFIGDMNILGWIAVAAIVIYFIDKVIMKNK